jgi:hypothetical protein
MQSLKAEAKPGCVTNRFCLGLLRSAIWLHDINKIKLRLQSQGYFQHNWQIQLHLENTGDYNQWLHHSRPVYFQHLVLDSCTKPNTKYEHQINNCIIINNCYQFQKIKIKLYPFITVLVLTVTSPRAWEAKAKTKMIAKLFMMLFVQAQIVYNFSNGQDTNFYTRFDDHKCFQMLLTLQKIGTKCIFGFYYIIFYCSHCSKAAKVYFFVTATSFKEFFRLYM